MIGIDRSLSKLGVYAYLASPTDTTTTTTPDEFTPISGVFTNDPIEGFSLGAGALVYDGIDNIYFEIDWHAAFKLSNANKTIHFGISINSETITTASTGVVGTFAKNNNQTYAVSGTQVAKLSKGDTIQLQITSSSASSTITVEHFTTTINRFFVTN